MRRTTTIAAVSAIALLLAAGQAMSQSVPELRIGSEVKARLDAEDTARNRERVPEGPATDAPPVIVMDGGAPDILYEDYFFTARAGQRLEAVMRSADFDTYLAVFPEGRTAQDPIARDDDGLDEGTDSRLLFTPETDGRYVLRAKELGGGDGGAYTLGLAERPPAPPAQAPTVIVLGELVRGTIKDTDVEADDGAFYDVYRFQAVAGQRLAIRMEAVGEGEETGIDPLLRVGQMQGEVFTELAMNDDSDGLNPRLIFTASDAGDYVVRAEALRGGSGDYSLSLTEAPEMAASRPIVIDETIRGSIAATDGVNSTGQRADLYRFTGRTGQMIAVEMKSSALDTYLTLFVDPDGERTLLAEDDDGLGDGTNSRLTHTLPSDGDYLIEARHLSGEETGAYTLTLSEALPPPAPTPLAAGAVVQGEISDSDPRDNEGRRYDAYAFSGTEGNRVQLVVRSGDFDTLVQVGRVGEPFAALGTDDDGLGEGTDSRLTYILPATGDYVVRALPLSAGDDGVYSIEMTERGPQPGAGSILIGATARGKLTEADAVSEDGMFFDAYRLSAKAGDKLTITLVSNDFDAFIDVGSEDEDAAFNSIKTDDDGLSDTHAKLDWTVEEDGIYVIRARALAASETGSYALRVVRDR